MNYELKKAMDTNKQFKYWQWRTILVTMVGYALFYFVRKNFSIAMPALKSELGLDETQLGIFLTLNGIVYGVSRFINGFISDRARSKKLIMGLGLLLSAVVNFVIGLSPQMNGLFHYMDASGKATVGLVYFIGSLWLINGFTQGMGYPPCGSLMAHWIKPSELATKQSIWNSSHSIGVDMLFAQQVEIVCSQGAELRVALYIDGLTESLRHEGEIDTEAARQVYQQSARWRTIGNSGYWCGCSGDGSGKQLACHLRLIAGGLLAGALLHVETWRIDDAIDGSP